MGHLAHNHFLFRSRLVDICMYDCTCLYANETMHTTYSFGCFRFYKRGKLKSRATEHNLMAAHIEKSS